MQNHARLPDGAGPPGVEAAAPSSFVYVDCPACGEGLPLPYVRGSGPLPVVHRNRRLGKGVVCRVVIVVARAGNRHPGWVVPDGRTFEEVLMEIHRTGYAAR